MTVNSFIQPTKLFLADASDGVKGIRSAILAKQLTPQFDFNNELIERQFKATSKDGTEVGFCLLSLSSFFSFIIFSPLSTIFKVPYFMISHKNMKFNSLNPTILYGYGGFEISITPNYQSVTGAAWLDHRFFSDKGEKYPCYVVANIRGGGEYGPKWHQAALKENR
jgi:prolyl oligopeptidase